MSTVVAVRGALPGNRYPQEQITAELASYVLGDADPARERLLRQVHAAAGVRTRHLALPLAGYAQLSGFGEANDVFIEVGTALAEQALTAALDAAGLAADQVDLIVSTSVTGIATPSLEARLAPRVGLREDVRRIPVFGLGCVAGAAGIARVHDYLVGHPDAVAVLLAVELCSLTVQRDDVSTANLVASGLFGDGAAAVVMVGADRARALGLDGPRVRATRSRLYPDSQDVMGWRVGDSGFRIVLAATVADVVERYLRDDVEGFLAANDLKVEDVGSWVAHPGGPKVIDAVTRTLALDPGALDLTRNSLATVGNLSSASVLHVLADTMDAGSAAPGSHGVLLALGPGFCSELVLLQW